MIQFDNKLVSLVIVKKTKLDRWPDGSILHDSVCNLLYNFPKQKRKHDTNRRVSTIVSLQRYLQLSDGKNNARYMIIL